jgi:hypothetical protein
MNKPAPDQQHRAKGTRRTIHKQPETYTAGIAALVGIQSKAIAAQTGLSVGQVVYRLKQTGAGQGRLDYRQGKGPIAEFILKKARTFVEHEFVERMREKLNLQKTA